LCWRKGVSFAGIYIQDEEFEHEYKIDSATQLEFKECYQKLAKKILKIQPETFLKDINKYLPSKLIQDKIKLNTLRNPDANLADILAVAYSASLFCYFFDCSFEYFISVSNVSLGKKYSLGSIAVGIKNGAELSFDERAMFSIISNHIASNLSAQIIFENNESIKLRDSRENFKKLFDKYSKVLDSDKKDRSHSNDKIDSSILKLWKQQSEEYTEPVKPFITDEKKYSTFLKDGDLTHQGLLLNVYLDKSKEKFLREKSIFYKSITSKGFSGMKYDYIDFIFVEEFLSLLKENKGGNTNGNNISIDCKHDGNKQSGFKNKRLEIKVEFVGKESHFRMSDFYAKLKTAHSATGTNFTTFILNHYDLIRIHGDLEIVDETGTSHFLLSRDSKLNSKDSKNPFLEISKENIPLDSFRKLNFVIHIQHELK
jgi:hypothetical protein